MKHDFEDGRYRVVIRPNRSLTPHQMVFFYLLVLVAALVVAIRFYLLGAWVVLPITLLEMLVLGIALILFERSTRLREVINLSEDNVSVSREQSAHKQSWQFQPYWVRLVLQKDAIDWYPSRLFLQSHGRRVEIGKCLTEEERSSLYEDLGKHLKVA